ncbi:cell division protein SepF [Myceligenerans xiligouense]|uniref:Cell division protein SepF n=1 Tax=Myceligenerans xiligouense TaxID=253184 RepID=A0A3N4ZM98_9MICO|nr:cell division protein SepF [Myceligenerans xiligouense]RPF22035.1 cell division inhibitor SepF [Myceligenerans xiligouense]
MAGALRKTMLYLGLADEQGERDAYYDEYEDVEETVQDHRHAQVTPLHPDGAPGDVPLSTSELRRITTVHPRSYNDARMIGEAFRSGTPVIMNLTDMDDADAKRLVDFSAGLIFGLHGSIDRVTNKVFLLSPEHVEIAGEEHVPEPPVTGKGGFYNQS